jgi:hypothetical protein
MFKSYVAMVMLTMVILLLASSPRTTEAHSASELVLEYDFPNQTLNATVTHVVVNPNTHYISTVEIFKNDVPFDNQTYVSQPTSDTFEYTYSVPAADGDVLKVRVNCSAFGSLTNQITVVGPPPDSEDPTISITSPTAEITYDTDSTPVSIGGTASDNMAVTSVTWNNSATGGSGTATGTTSWSAIISLAVGENNITLTARDAVGNTGSDNLTIIYTPLVADTTDPLISITSPSTGQTHDTEATPITISGTASDNVDVVNVTWANDATGASGMASGTTSWSISVPLAEGVNTITITVSDGAGNTATSSISFDYSIPDQPADEKPISWVYHASLMSVGFVLLVTTMTVSTAMRKKKWWLKVHRSLGILGSLFAVLGLLMGMYMISVWATPHFRVPHAILGLTTVIFAITQPVLGFVHPKMPSLRPVHRWLGRVVVIMMLISIIAGLSQAGVL